jgi:hypothetical protein
LAIALVAAGDAARAWTPARLFDPCDGTCGIAVYAGDYVEEGMNELLFTDPETPLTWDYQDDHIAAISASRDVARFWRDRIHVEPELGFGKRFGMQEEYEVWGAVFFRYHGFPWDDVLMTTFAVSTGLNWSSDISAVEQERAKDDTGARWMHFFSPEITFALPSRSDIELLLRFHHRSGVFGLVNDAFGGAQYGTVGVRVRF